MEVGSKNLSLVSKAIQPKVFISVGFTLAFYCLVRGFEGVKFADYPTQPLMPQTALVLMSLLAIVAMWWLNGRQWSYYLLAHIFALGFGTATLLAWSSYDFGSSGIISDSWFSTAIVAKYKHTWTNTDFAYKGLHSFYPSLYQFVLGKFAAITGTSVVKAMKYGGYWTAYLLPLAAYGLWRKLLAELPAFLMIVISMVICRPHLTFKPFEVIAAVVFVPWALYFVAGLRAKEVDGKAVWEVAVLTRREIWIGGWIAGLVFMTYYYYFFLFIVWIPIQIAVELKTGATIRQLWARYRAFGGLIGLMMLVSAAYWVPLLVDMAKYGMHSYQNRWFQPHMFNLPLDVGNSWKAMVGLVVLIGLAPTNRLARTVLVFFVALVAYAFVGELGMYNQFPILHIRMVGLEDYLLQMGLIFGALQLMQQFKGLLQSPWEKMLPVALMAVFSMGMAMNFVWEKNNDNSKTAANSKMPMLSAFPEFNEISRGKVLLTNRIDMAAVRPIYLFICPNAHYSHPASRYRERVKFLVLLSKSKDSDFLAWMLQYNRYDRVDQVLLDDRSLELFDDNFPSVDNHIRIPVQFQECIFEGNYFAQDPHFHEVQHVRSMPADLWKTFTQEQLRLVALFSDQDREQVRAQVPSDVLKAMEDELRIRTTDYLVWQRVFWARYLGGE